MNAEPLTDEKIEYIRNRCLKTNYENNGTISSLLTTLDQRTKERDELSQLLKISKASINAWKEEVDGSAKHRKIVIAENKKLKAKVGSLEQVNHALGVMERVLCEENKKLKAKVDELEDEGIDMAMKGDDLIISKARLKKERDEIRQKVAKLEQERANSKVWANYHNANILNVKLKEENANFVKALSLLHPDPHQWSGRPCKTCQEITEIIKTPFGCYWWQKAYKKITNPTPQ